MVTPRLACFALVILLFGQLNPAAAVCQYRIKTRTGILAGAGSHAVASVRLYGSEANCGWRSLNTNGVTLWSNNYFTVTCPCLGCVLKLRIRHNNAGVNPSWYLVYVGVRRLPGPSLYQKFPCKKWLSSSTSLNRKLTSSKTPYRIRIRTGSQLSAGTNAAVKFSLISNTIGAVLMSLNSGFPRFSTRTFYRNIVNICPVKQVYITHNNAGSGPSWFIRRIYVYNRAMKIHYRCNCYCWLFSPSNLAKTLTCQKL
ncbi:hypothetical protein NP493_1773g00053 [Ridgeia piscesae]|uniref:PLAT domain-containing protein n=1 Tax=Ridgeia piscesae TaxID=27915 RepID=A0AAD9N8A8_RIDPI|nr:hypothetical protein NP493_1773g00053 [Ridgeia piscesae]